jgi:Fe2+ or Zn2+ uptake regulation protein
MSVKLVILGLLRERPLYGYEIKQIIEEHMGDWTSIAFGSIYFALDKLAKEGFVEKVATATALHAASTRSRIQEALNSYTCCARCGRTWSGSISSSTSACSL